ncbi:MAG: hypothetical protein K0S26_1083, partial [Bacteroidota bacterium]|nr:hypothetical protein [Bacteroidota bacterium]
MRTFYTILVLFIFVLAKSQNLVPNPSFESFTSCPTAYQQINRASPWITSSGFSADYYNSCSTSTNVSVPKNLYNANFQYPKNGNGFAGINTINGIGNDFKQTISSSLNSGLLNNSYYLCKFYLSNVNCYPYAHNNISLSFTSTLTFSVACSCPLNLPMHIYKFGNPVIKDT